MGQKRNSRQKKTPGQIAGAKIKRSNNNMDKKQKTIIRGLPFSVGCQKSGTFRPVHLRQLKLVAAKEILVNRIRPLCKKNYCQKHKGSKFVDKEKVMKSTPA